jgi:hypothetical protein
LVRGAPALVAAAVVLPRWLQLIEMFDLDLDLGSNRWG